MCGTHVSYIPNLYTGNIYRNIIYENISKNFLWMYNRVTNINRTSRSTSINAAPHIFIVQQNREIPPRLQSHLKSIIKKAIDEAPLSALDGTEIHSFYSRFSNILQLMHRCSQLYQLDELILNNVKKADSISEWMTGKKSTESYKSPKLKSSLNVDQHTW